MRTKYNTGLPVLLDTIEVPISFDITTLEVQVTKTRKIRLLEWAIMAPISQLVPLPSIAEIADKFGVDRVEFLTGTAEILSNSGIIRKINRDYYEMTDVGRKFFERGEVTSSPRRVYSKIVYQPEIEEWFTGFKDDLSQLSGNNEHISFQPADNIGTFSSIEIPENLIHEHLRMQDLVEKNESISNYSIVRQNTASFNIRAKVILKESGMAVKPSRTSIWFK